MTDLDRITELDRRMKAAWVPLFQAQLELIEDLTAELDAAKAKIRELESGERTLPEPVFYNREVTSEQK